MRNIVAGSFPVRDYKLPFFFLANLKKKTANKVCHLYCTSRGTPLILCLKVLESTTVYETFCGSRES